MTILTTALCLGIVAGVVVTSLVDFAVRCLPRARICAWCPRRSPRRLMRGGYLPATHGICPACAKKLER